jgi:hypothetical protein
MKAFARGGIALVAVLALGACGGGSKNTAASNPTVPSTTVAPTTTNGASASPAAKPWVDALMHNAMTSKDRPPGITEALVRCMANAAIDTYGVGGFQRAGYTPALLAGPVSQFDKLPATEPYLSRLGARLQRCRPGAVAATALVGELPGATRANSNACFTRAFDNDSRARRFLALNFLNRDPDLTAAHVLVDFAEQCTDLGAIALADIPGLTPAERACAAPKIASSQAFRDVLVQQLLGTAPTPRELGQIAGEALSACVSPQRLAQLAHGVRST